MEISGWRGSATERCIRPCERRGLGNAPAKSSPDLAETSFHLKFLEMKPGIVKPGIL